jgi:hypothetical protein
MVPLHVQHPLLKFPSDFATWRLSKFSKTVLIIHVELQLSQSENDGTSSNRLDLYHEMSGSCLDLNIYSEFFSGFPKFHHVNGKMVPQLGHNYFQILSNSCTIICHTEGL